MIKIYLQKSLPTQPETDGPTTCQNFDRTSEIFNRILSMFANQASSVAVGGLHKHLLAEVLNFLVLGLIQRCENNGEEYLASFPLCAYRPAGQRSRILLESAAMISSYEVIQKM